MKKSLKKFAALLLALAMVFAMGITTFAATKDSATITVTANGKPTMTYVQVIKPDQSTKTGWAFCSDEIANAYITAFTVEGQTAPTAQEVIETLIASAPGYNNNDEVKAALAAIKTNTSIAKANFTSPQTVNSAGVYAIYAVDSNTTDDVEYTYNDMAAYVGFGEVTVDGTTYAYPSLMDATITAKESDNNIGKTTADANKVTQIGDIVEYTITTTVPYVDESYTGDSIVFKIKDTITGADYYFTGEKSKFEVKVDDTAYTVTTPTPVENADGSKYFIVDLSALLKDANGNASNAKFGKTVTVTYTAKVTGTQVGNTPAKLTPGHEDDEWTEGDGVDIYTGKITLTKYGEDDTTLAGATFNVYKTTTSVDDEGNTVVTATGDPLKFTANNDVEYVYDPDGTTTNVVTGDDGTLVVKGLDVGTYKFVETVAPEGYSINETGATATLEITDGAKEATAELTATTRLNDTKLSALPSTGGMGTYLFTIGGVVIMVAAAGLLIASKKRNA